MHVIIAPNAFKGSLSAEDAARCIADGLRESDLACTLTCFPVADGGDDTASLLVKGMGGETLDVSVHDPLGRPMVAGLGWIAKDRTAIIGLSDASGLKLLKAEELNPLHANTFGSGELIRAALDQDVRRLLIGAGGSATVDGGTGLLRASGLRFLDQAGNGIEDLPAGLLRLEAVDITALDTRLRSCEIVILCDVENKLLGRDGAAAVFGPQKGAGEKEVILLDKCLRQWNDVTKNATGVEMAALKYSGAAGGVAAGMAAYTKAKLAGGIEYFLDEMHFDDVLPDADLVITAEGRIDGQTLEGKGPLGVARRAKAKNIAVIGMAGQIPAQAGNKMQHYFDRLVCINPVGMTLEAAISNTSVNLKQAAFELGNGLVKKYTG